MRLSALLAALAGVLCLAPSAWAQQTQSLTSRFAQATTDSLLDEGDERLALYRRSGDTSPQPTRPARSIMGWLTRDPDHPSSLYVSGSALQGFRDDDHGQSGLRYQEGLAWLGADRRFGSHWVLGAAIGYGGGEAKSGLGGMTTTTEAAKMYTMYEKGSWFGQGGILFNYNQYDHISDRSTSTPGNASTDGYSWGSAISGGYLPRIGGFRMGPVAGLRFSSVHVDDYTEERGGNNLSVGEQDLRRLAGEFGSEIQAASLSRRYLIAPRLRSTIETVLYERRGTIAVSDSLGNDLSTETTQEATIRSRLRAGVGGSLGHGATFGADAEAIIGKGGVDERLSAELHFAF